MGLPFQGEVNSQAWYHTPVVPELGRQRQEHHKFEASLRYIVRSCFQKKVGTDKEQILH
jgi:hypothetical protein